MTRLKPSIRIVAAGFIMSALCPIHQASAKAFIVKDGKLVRVEGMKDSPLNRGRNCPKAFQPFRDSTTSAYFRILDSVLTEEGSDQEGMDMGATRGGYEEYGHVVDLNGSGAGKGRDKEQEEQAEEKDENDIEIIASPLEKPSISKPKAIAKRPEPVKEADKAPKEQVSGTASAVLTKKKKKTIKVPLEISADDIGKDVEVELLLQIKVKKD